LGNHPDYVLAGEWIVHCRTLVVAIRTTSLMGTAHA